MSDLGSLNRIQTDALFVCLVHHAVLLKHHDELVTHVGVIDELLQIGRGSGLLVGIRVCSVRSEGVRGLLDPGLVSRLGVLEGLVDDTTPVGSRVIVVGRSSVATSRVLNAQSLARVEIPLVVLRQNHVLAHSQSHILVRGLLVEARRHWL